MTTDRPSLTLIKGQDYPLLHPELDTMDSFLVALSWLNRLTSLVIHNVPLEDQYACASELVSVVASYTQRPGLMLAPTE